MPDVRFWRDASRRLTFDVAGVPAAEYPTVCSAIASALALVPDDTPVFGPEQMFWDFARSGEVVSLDWDLWMGFMVVGKSAGSEALVQEIAAWLRASPWVEAGDAA